MLRRGVLMGLLALGGTGCYTYSPRLTAAFPPDGAEVRIRYIAVDPPAATESTVEPPVISVKGRVVSWDAVTTRIAVPPPPTVEDMGAGRKYPKPDTLAIPARRIRLVEIRELDRTRTAAFALGAGIGAVVLGRLLMGWVRASPDPEPVVIEQ